MPRREARERSEQLREQAKTNPAIAAVLRKRRKAALKGIAVRKAGEVAADVLADAAPTADPRGVQMRRGVKEARAAMAELRRSFAGQGERIAEAMKRADKSEADVANATGIHLHSIKVVLHDRTKTMLDRNIAKIATYLGANYGYLRSGVEGETPTQFTIDAVADVVPHKANGKHHAPLQGRLDAAMGSSIDTTIQALWTLLPMDAKLMVIARVAELVAMQGKR